MVIGACGDDRGAPPGVAASVLIPDTWWMVTSRENGAYVIGESMTFSHLTVVGQMAKVVDRLGKRLFAVDSSELGTVYLEAEDTKLAKRVLVFWADPPHAGVGDVNTGYDELRLTDSGWSTCAADRAAELTGRETKR